MTVTNTVVERVAAKEGCDPLELPPLWESIDTEALEQCLNSAETPIEIQFRYCRYSITVRVDEAVTVTIADDEESVERNSSP